MESPANRSTAALENLRHLFLQARATEKLDFLDRQRKLPASVRLSKSSIPYIPRYRLGIGSPCSYYSSPRSELRIGDRWYPRSPSRTQAEAHWEKRRCGPHFCQPPCFQL